MTKVYLSTGAFTGRMNGRNHRLALEYANAFPSDGFEWMISENGYDRLDDIASEYRRAGLCVPVVHADKDIGNLVGDPSPEALSEGLTLWQANCRAAAEVGAEKIVVHLWGLPHSDRHFDCVLARCGEMAALACRYGLEMVPENIVCDVGSPLERMESLAAAYPELRFTVDTRLAQFHAELSETCESALLRQGRYAHIHINDYAGGYKEWEHLRSVLQPGKGEIDFVSFFAALVAGGYDGSITLEAASMRAEGVDVETLTAGLWFIRDKLAKLREG